MASTLDFPPITVFSKATVRRAAAAAATLKALYLSTFVPEKGLRLPSGEFFSERAFEDLFEMGDSTEVVVALMDMADKDTDLLSAMHGGWSARYTSYAHWSEIREKYRASTQAQGLLPL